MAKKRQEEIMLEFAGKHILIIIENLPAPFDTRVWQEANSLKKQGAEVSIICPKMKGYKLSYENINGIDIYRHPLWIEAEGALGYFLEYTSALLWEFFLCWKIFFRKRFHVIQACNPPDLIFSIAFIFKIFGVKFVFDHHDLNPELYIAKYNKKDFFYKLMGIFEKLTFKTADFSIATNESYKDIAIKRGGMLPEKVQVVRSGPSLERLKIQAPKPEYKRGKKYLIGYLGVIGHQEGIDLLFKAITLLQKRRNDFHVAIIGSGTALNGLKQLSSDLGISELVEFHGRVSDKVLLEILNTADICVNPDRPTEMNNLSTMNKIMEYMALKKPIVQFDLKEGRFSAQEASLYIKDENLEVFADKLCLLMNDAQLRIKMGEYGFSRIKNNLSWKYEELKLIELYSKVLNLKIDRERQFSIKKKFAEDVA